MPKHKDIISFISEIRNSHSKMVDIFTKGSCLNFYLILKQVYPESEAYYDYYGHIITKIGDKFYDINGTVLVPLNPIKYSTILTPKNMRRMFKEMYQNEADLC